MCVCLQIAPASAIPSSVGISSIVGSANVNVLAVVGLSVIYAGQTLPLQPLPVLRDVAFYVFTIATLTGCVVDGVVHWCGAAEGSGSRHTMM